jgi:hypothetical protein
MVVDAGAAADDGIDYKRRPGDDLAKQIAEGRNPGPSDRGPPQSHEELCQMDRDLGGHHEKNCSKRPPAPETVKVAAQIAATEDQTSLAAQTVTDTINASYLPGLEKCWRSLLAIELDSGGGPRFSLTLTVEASGKTSKVAATDDIGVELHFEACVKSQAAAWKFPAPTSDGKPSKARFTVPLQFSVTYKPGVIGGELPRSTADTLLSK